MSVWHAAWRAVPLACCAPITRAYTLTPLKRRAAAYRIYYCRIGCSCRFARDQQKNRRGDALPT